MKNFNFKIYKSTKIYFTFYDIFIKEQGISKKDIFDKLYISNSSYRRARESEQKVGKLIIKELSNYYKLQIPSEVLVDKVEELSNKIYYNMYYKIFDSFDKDLNYINELLAKNNLLFPVLKLLKLFLLKNQSDSLTKIYDNYYPLFIEVKPYYNFFNDDLKEIYEMIDIFFDQKFDILKVWNKDFSNPLFYQIICAKCKLENNYIGTIFFGTKANLIYEKDYNFKRMFGINRNIMGSLLKLENYEECYKLSSKQLLSIQALKYSEYEVRAALSFKIVSLLGMNRFNEIIREIKNLTDINLNLLTCLLISLYKTDIDKYESYYKENIVNAVIPNDFQEYLNILDNYLKTSNKKLLLGIEKYNIMSVLSEMLKKF